MVLVGVGWCGLVIVGVGWCGLVLVCVSWCGLIVRLKVRVRVGVRVRVRVKDISLKGARGERWKHTFRSPREKKRKE